MQRSGWAGRHDRWRDIALSLAPLLPIVPVFLIASSFSFFVSDYGDAPVYFDSFKGTRPAMTYQPAYPVMLYFCGELANPASSILFAQASLYAAACVVAGRRIGAPLVGWATAAYLVIDLRYYFYVAMPMT